MSLFELTTTLKRLWWYRIVEVGSGQGPRWAQIGSEPMVGLVGTEGMNRLCMRPTRPLHFRFFIELNVSPAWHKHSRLALTAKQPREKEMHCKKYE